MDGEGGGMKRWELTDGWSQEAAANASQLLVKEFKKVNQQTDPSDFAILNNVL